MRIIAIANQKGGCGKTTTAINLSASLAFLGKKTLLVDLDPQGHSTLGLGYSLESFGKSLYDVLSPVQNQIPLEEVIQQVAENHYLVPSQVILSAIEQQLAGVYGREEKLMEKLRPVRSQYDYVLIDCPPNLGLLTFNALRAADELIIPVEPSFFSVNGLKKIRETVGLIEETLKHHITIHALLTLFNGRSNFNQKILLEMQHLFENQLLKTIISQNIRLREAAQTGKSICDFDRKSTGFRDYMNLATEIIERQSPQISTSKEIIIREKKQDNMMIGREERVQIADSFNIPTQMDREIDVNIEEGPIWRLSNSKNHETEGKETERLEEEWRIKQKYPILLKDGVILGYSDPQAKMVQVAGDFNNWVNEAMDMSGGNTGHWMKYVSLAPGRYRYKFIVDGEWTVDWQNQITEPNPYGGIDSVIVIGKSSEEILDERSSKI